MHLVFENDVGLLVHHTASVNMELRRVAFPARPHPTVEPEDWIGLHPCEFLRTHGFPRAEAFALVQQFLCTGELPTSCPRPATVQLHLPWIDQSKAMESGEWWRVEWVWAGSMW
jgi:hypothetical protein